MGTSLPADFDGLGVLDWESWSFAWSHMKLQGWTAKTDVRVNKSIELVLADHPGMSMAAAEVEAGRRWDRAVQIFVEATLATLHELRPRGKFGVFGYPDCGPQTGYSAPANLWRALTSSKRSTTTNCRGCGLLRLRCFLATISRRLQANTHAPM